jgi:hypothetical protein
MRSIAIVLSALVAAAAAANNYTFPTGFNIAQVTSTDKGSLLRSLITAHGQLTNMETIHSCLVSG